MVAEYNKIIFGDIACLGSFIREYFPSVEGGLDGPGMTA
jgi:hypothetical protein